MRLQHTHQIYGKAEFLNPGGSVKDRIALQITREALACGQLVPGAQGTRLVQDELRVLDAYVPVMLSTWMYTCKKRLLASDLVLRLEARSLYVLTCVLAPPGALITEGTAGSTGVSLALVAAATGCRAFVALPDDAAVEKAAMLEVLGAEVSVHVHAWQVGRAYMGHHVKLW